MKILPSTLSRMRQELLDRGKAQSIHVEFWDSMPNYFVDWKYDPVENVYKRNTMAKTPDSLIWIKIQINS